MTNWFVQLITVICKEHCVASDIIQTEENYLSNHEPCEVYSTTLYCTILCCTILQCTVQLCTVMYCTVQWGQVYILYCVNDE